jgi:protein-disulfide isomerase/uncharacterized membrane protein
MQRHLTSNIRGLLKGFFVITTLGWINALYALWHRQSLLFGSSAGKSFCNISDRVNCDLVAMAPESAFFFGYPTSALGLSFYCAGFFIAWALYSETSAARARAQAKLLLVISLIGLLPTFYLAMVSIFKIQSLCLMCLGSYLLNLTLVVLSFLIFRKTPAEESAPLTSAVPKNYLIAILVSAAIHFPLPWIFKSVAGGAVTDDVVGLYLYRHQNAQKFRFRTEGSATLGNPDAPVQIVEFADFECPDCAQADEIVPVVIKSFSPNISMTFKNFPLDMSCNEAMEASMHPNACDAARAGLCVLKEKGSPSFFEFKKIVFQNHSSLSLGALENFAQDQGVSKDTLKTCMESSEIKDELRRQTLEAKAAGVKGTPSFYVNGKILDGASVPAILRKVVNDYLKQSEK